MLPSTVPTHRAHMEHNCRQQGLLLLKSQRQQVHGAETHDISRLTSTHMFTDPPSTDTALLPAQHPCPNPIYSHSPHGSPTCRLLQCGTCCKHIAHSHPSGTSHTGQAEYHRKLSAHLILLTQKWGLLLSGESSFVFSSNYTCTPYAYQLWGRYRLSAPPAAGTKHMTGDPVSCPS